jgi:hypothetical protein
MYSLCGLEILFRVIYFRSIHFFGSFFGGRREVEKQDADRAQYFGVT